MIQNIVSRHMKTAAGKPYLSNMGLTKSKAMAGEAAMLYSIEAGSNKSKYYEMIIVVADDGTAQLIKANGRLGSPPRMGRPEQYRDLDSAKRALAKAKRSKINGRSAYKDAFDSKHHKTPDGKQLPKGQYPVGLASNPGSWKNQDDIHAMKPTLKRLVQKINEAVADADNADMNSVLDDLQAANALAMQLGRSSMAEEIKKKIKAPLARLQGGGRHRVDPIKVMREMKSLSRYISKQLSMTMTASIVSRAFTKTAASDQARIKWANKLAKDIEKRLGAENVRWDMIEEAIEKVCGEPNGILLSQVSYKDGFDFFASEKDIQKWVSGRGKLSNMKHPKSKRIMFREEETYSTLIRYFIANYGSPSPRLVSRTARLKTQDLRACPDWVQKAAAVFTKAIKATGSDWEWTQGWQKVQLNGNVTRATPAYMLDFNIHLDTKWWVEENTLNVAITCDEAYGQELYYFGAGLAAYRQNGRSAPAVQKKLRSPQEVAKLLTNLIKKSTKTLDAKFKPSDGEMEALSPKWLQEDRAVPEEFYVNLHRQRYARVQQRDFALALERERRLAYAEETIENVAYAMSEWNDHRNPQDAEDLNDYVDELMDDIRDNTHDGDQKLDLIQDERYLVKAFAKARRIRMASTKIADMPSFQWPLGAMSDEDSAKIEAVMQRAVGRGYTVWRKTSVGATTDIVVSSSRMNWEDFAADFKGFLHDKISKILKRFDKVKRVNVPAVQRTNAKLLAHVRAIKTAKSAKGVRWEGPHVIVDTDRMLSIKGVPKDEYKQVYDAAILQDSRNGVRMRKLVLQIVLENKSKIMRMRSPYEVTDFIDQQAMALKGKKPRWHSYSMPD